MRTRREDREESAYVAKPRFRPNPNPSRSPCGSSNSTTNLHGDIPIPDDLKIYEHARDIAQLRVKDFQKIDDWTIDNHNMAFDFDITWLKNQIIIIQEEKKTIAKGQSERSILVVSHHAPASLQETSSPKYVDNPWSSAFAADLLTDEDWVNVKVWMFGQYTRYD
jgi:hypothetical protein